MMIIRQASTGDIERMHKLFSSMSVSRGDISSPKIPQFGFYEYPLTEGNFAQRVNNQPFSLIIEQGVELKGYILAYKVRDIPSHEPKDAVLNRIGCLEKDIVYVDQLCMQPGLPIHLAGRFIDTFEHVLRCEKIPGIAAVIPQKPWTNVSSTRLALHRGLYKAGLISAGEIEFAVFGKPYWDKDIPFKLN